MKTCNYRKTALKKVGAFTPARKGMTAGKPAPKLPTPKKQAK